MEDIEILDDQLRAVPYGGISKGNEIQIYAVKIATEQNAHAVGFDDQTNEWNHLALVDAKDLSSADDELDTVLDDWVQRNYAGQFDVLKPVRG